MRTYGSNMINEIHMKHVCFNSNFILIIFIFFSLRSIFLFIYFPDKRHITLIKRVAVSRYYYNKNIPAKSGNFLQDLSRHPDYIYSYR